MAQSEQQLEEPAAGGLAGIVGRNIRALVAVRQEHDRRRSGQDRVADAITRFAGSLASVYFHLLLFGGWIVVNSGLIPGVRPFDPFPFVMLAMWASVEAIFLSTFVLISQNRMSAMDQKRADLDLQISLLSEHEVTRLVQMVDAIAHRLGVDEEPGTDLEELKQDVLPEVVLEEMEHAEARATGSFAHRA